MSEKKPLIFAPETYQYDKFKLEESQVEKNPILQFKKWFEEASKDEDIPESVTLSTASLPSGRISSRVVLLKELDDRGFIVFSNWDQSKKAKDIRSNKHVALNFFWKKLQRQVRVEGIAEFTPREVNENYFKTRPRGSQVGAWLSPQSQVIASREKLEQIVAENEKKFEGQETVPCPEFWGGLRVIPLEIEFWQGRPSRLHDRISFRRDDLNEDFKMVRIAP